MKLLKRFHALREWAEDYSLPTALLADFVMVLPIALIFCGTIALCSWGWAFASSPDGVAASVSATAEPTPSTADLLKGTSDIVNALHGHKWMVALPALLMLLGQLMKTKIGKFLVGWLLEKAGSRYRGLVISGIGFIATLATTLASGVPLVPALLSSIVAPAGATGLYEWWKTITTPHESDLLKWALTLTDAKAKDQAVEDIANGKVPEGFKS